MQHVATFAHKSIPQVSIFNARQLFRVLRSLPGRYFKKKQIKSRHANLQYCFEKETLQLASFSPRALRASKLLVLPVTGSSSRSG